MPVELLIMGGITLFVAFVIREAVGGKRSSAGVHRGNGKILPTELGVLVTLGIVAIGALVAGSLAPVLISGLGTGGAILIALVLAYLVISRENYNR